LPLKKQPLATKNPKPTENNLITADDLQETRSPHSPKWCAIRNTVEASNGSSTEITCNFNQLLRKLARKFF